MTRVQRTLHHYCSVVLAVNPGVFLSVRHFSLHLAAIVVLLTAACGCSEEWWTRGQTRGVPDLLARSRQQLDLAQAGSLVRPEIRKSSQDIEDELLRIWNGMERSSGETGQLYARLELAMQESSASITPAGRPAFYALLSQCRSFAALDRNEKSLPNRRLAFGLFAARTLFFLAGEAAIGRAG